MKAKKMLCVLMILFIVSLCFSINSFALDPVSAMSSSSNDDVPEGVETIKPVINSIIGIIQVAGTGIALIMVSILGIKYLMAAPNEKADVKKQIAPMILGAILLFGAVNIMAIIANFTDDAFSLG